MAHFTRDDPQMVRAMLIAHTGRMLENLMQEVRLLGS
jgi:hypothetical protein